jgi:hypothetical protein
MNNIIDIDIYNKLKAQQDKHKKAMKDWATTHKGQISEYRRNYYITKLKPKITNNDCNVEIRAAQRAASKRYYLKIKAQNMPTTI